MESKQVDIQISIKCVDNAAGFPGVVVYDDKTFPISSKKRGRGSHGVGAIGGEATLKGQKFDIHGGGDPDGDRVKKFWNHWIE